MYRKASAIFATILLLTTLSVTVFASAVQDAWMIERIVTPTQDFNPTMYLTLDDAETTGASVPTIRKVAQAIHATGAKISHYEGLQGSSSGVYGRIQYGWQSSGGDTEAVYWLATTYVITLQKDSGITQASTYTMSLDGDASEVDTVTGSFSFGVATMQMTCTLYRTTTAIQANNAVVTQLNVAYQSGTFAMDGMYYPVVIPQYYTNSDQALAALEGIQGTLDEIKDGLFGDYSDAEMDHIDDTVSKMQDIANSMGGALVVPDVDITPPDIGDGMGGLNSVRTVWDILFTNDWVVYLITLSLGLVVLKVILYGGAN